MIMENKQLSYEESIARIRSICDKLRESSTSLEETASLFKEALGLIKSCRETLNKVSAEIEDEEYE